ncbi:MAG: penicillin-binding protein 1B [Gammaproteobacteria bacterium]|nr:penicillin-binding protein 1B [Gammaproteobacteria bacterium]
MSRKHPGGRRRRNRFRKNPRAAPAGNFIFFISTRILGGLFFVTLVFLLYLDLEIRQRLDLNLQSQPAHVYSSPLHVFPGKVLSPDRLSKNLRERGYQQVQNIAEPRTFATGNHAIDVFTTRFHHGPGEQQASAVRVQFQGDTVVRITDHRSASDLRQILVEPVLIGSLQLGAYKDRISLQLHEMPELMIKALLAMEDRQFASHYGFDFRAIMRAMWSNLREGKTVQGGSTLTQQLVKNLFLTPQRTITRKVTEALMAILIELRFSKAEILELYINEIFLGQSGNRAVHGFGLASEFYFGRPLNQLKLHETALLVGIIPAPSYYNPRRHPKRAMMRRNLVLDTLAQLGGIPASTASSLSGLPLGISEYRSRDTSAYPAYLDYLHRQLRRFYPEEILRTRGLKLFTSLDVEIQQHTQKALTATLLQLEKQKKMGRGTLQGAAIVVDPRQGNILAIVGDRIPGFSGYNRAIDAERPIGSLVKPAVYLTALEQHRTYSLASILEDSPLTLRSEKGEPWSPRNHDKEFLGPLPMYRGLIHSRNLPTVRLGMEIGVDRVVETMHRLGIDREIDNYPSTLLGASQHTPLEIAQMYQTIANNGIRIPLRPILSIQNQRSETVAKFAQSEHRVFDPGSIFLIDHALKLVVQQGTAAGLGSRFGPELAIAGKTGTTDNFRDSWFAGYSNNLLGVVWVGRDDNQPIHLSGSSGAMRVWEKIMANLDIQSAEPRKPDDVVFVDIDPNNGMVANFKCPEQLPLPFVRGSEPESFSPCSGLTTQSGSWFDRK